MRARLDLDKKRKSDGMVICDENLEEKLRQLCEDLNLDFEKERAHDPAPELKPEDQYRGRCPECGKKDRTLTHRDANGGGGAVGSECAEDLRAAAKRARMESG